MAKQIKEMSRVARLARRQAMAKLYRKGQPVGMIADRFGVTTRAVYNAVQEFGNGAKKK